MGSFIDHRWKVHHESFKQIFGQPPANLFWTRLWASACRHANDIESNLQRFDDQMLFQRTSQRAITCIYYPLSPVTCIFYLSPSHLHLLSTLLPASQSQFPSQFPSRPISIFCQPTSQHFCRLQFPSRPISISCHPTHSTFLLANFTALSCQPANLTSFRL